MVKKSIAHLFSKIGYRITKKDHIPSDIEKEFIDDIYKKTKIYTMTSIERMYALYKATEYIVRHQIPGDIVECGVWKGGSAMISALTLLKSGETQRKLYLYDTYEGMSAPTTKDMKYDNRPVIENWRRLQADNFNRWCYSPLEEVKNNLISTNYPPEKLIFIKGKVEDSIPNQMPDKISLLRLDTDWYESTYHELCYLFPKLSVNGVLILDDYGEWRGAREAIDKYIHENNTKILLNRIDNTGRIGIKVAP